ncbi:MAG TPA: hypothetical protein VIJ63_18455, partial [Roseiarcus sp.]
TVIFIVSHYRTVDSMIRKATPHVAFALRDGLALFPLGQISAPKPLKRLDPRQSRQSRTMATAQLSPAYPFRVALIRPQAHDSIRVPTPRKIRTGG